MHVRRFAHLIVSLSLIALAMGGCGEDEVKVTTSWPDAEDGSGPVDPWAGKDTIDLDTAVDTALPDTPEPPLDTTPPPDTATPKDTIEEVTLVDLVGPDTSTPLDTVEEDTWVYQDGTPEAPYLIPYDPYGPDYEHEADTSTSSVSQFDTYPPNETDECGTEIYYYLEAVEAIQLMAWIDSPEPDGVDVDLHLLGSLEPLDLIDRGHYSVEAMLDAGSYWLVMDTYCADGVPMPGPYHLTVSMQSFTPGTIDEPVLLGAGSPLDLPFAFTDVRDTSESDSDAIDEYPPNGVDMSGPEFVYTFTVDEPVRIMAYIEAPEPDYTDIDLNLLGSIDPPSLIARDDKIIYEIAEAGTYWLVADTYVNSSGTELAGPYVLHLSVREKTPAAGDMFNPYILAAVDWLYANYGILGYGSAALTHDIPYGDEGYVSATNPPLTMCVAAVMETILTAMNIYADETGDQAVFDFLPKWSWEGFQGNCIKAHIWVNYDLEAGGTADALLHFGMGYNVPFEELTPGSFINLNRTTGSGHAVVFLAFIDAAGNEYEAYPSGTEIIGFKYFSSQGGSAAGTGGLDFRYAIFSQYGDPTIPGSTYKKDLNVIESSDQLYLNTGIMLHPSQWVPLRAMPARCLEDGTCPVSEFDAEYFDGSEAM